MFTRNINVIHVYTYTNVSIYVQGMCNMSVLVYKICVIHMYIDTEILI